MWTSEGERTELRSLWVNLDVAKLDAVNLDVVKLDAVNLDVVKLIAMNLIAARAR
ncbi:hypothetical protein HD598_002012 [Neomicrococcus aestuarii]|uniref:Pentapeptide repeat-containing protein n=1 Tax=Neomicrococcus aestuarii TaxID=556325 RepID=A0A7W8TWC4_9MICC|nr:hypothetical protein [Neomicrococcus aestuarii]MBB5513325.1 hypothetical protein [Neomicrococcus aestuarii]